MNKEKYIKILVLLDRSRELCAREDKHLWEELFYVSMVVEKKIDSYGGFTKKEYRKVSEELAATVMPF
ncbi:MAG TPA: hypothetical protein VFA52_04235 [Candidatus Paceibacterota bacterium]|jgi:hypothetical protein|nr:hypothetical protein [Candidatus Paceibacterota bacterium]